MKKNKYKDSAILILSLTLSIVSLDLNSQVRENGEMNVINTAVPSIRLSPDARGSALGGAGISSSPDINSQHWNISKYVFLENPGGVSASFTPWMGVIPSKYLGYLVGYYKIDEMQSISSSLKYNSLGETILTDDIGTVLNTISPYDLFIDIGYARKLNDNLSAGVLFKYIYSNQTDRKLFGTLQSIPGQSFAADIGLYYQKSLESLGEFSRINLGFNLANLGTPVSYTEDLNTRMSLPTNLGFGSCLELGKDESNSLSIIIEINKLLVPTNPIMEGDSVLRGREHPNSIIGGILLSFIDAPGISYADGSYSSIFREEMAELTLSMGLEYKLQNQIYFRTGYFNENQIKGNRKYLSFGLGISRPVIINIAYIISLNVVGNPYSNTVQLSLGYIF